jgi:poly-gamma-glutamate capsule biosynthesis protein CapA/YwtB (metallophosphatase superfamily)
MKKRIVLFIVGTFLICFLTAQDVEVIEDFESGEIELFSYEDEDLEPDLWQLDSENTFENSAYSLKLFGNTWKQLTIEPKELTPDQVWKVHVFAEEIGTIQGIGFADSSNVLLYSFFGESMLDIETWIPVYQGAQDSQIWAEFYLPVADDWQAFFDYLPEITRIVFINDNDNNGDGITYFDLLLDVTDDLPKAPQVAIEYEIINDFHKNSYRYVDVHFTSVIIDEDSDTFTYLWDFADGFSSNQANPNHQFHVEDDHLYTVTLQIADDTNLQGYASCQLNVDEGEGTFPITMNFVGDIMLARDYNSIIPTQGFEIIFEPTLEVFGNAADMSSANLESPLTTSNEHHPTKPIYFKGHPDFAEGLAFAGIDVVTLANNHILDYMYSGLLETQLTLDNFQILHSGVGIDSYEASRPLIVSKKGKSFAFLASSDRTGQYNNYQPYLQAGFNKPGFAYMTPYYISQQISDIRDVVDFVVVETHSGSEYSTEPGADYDKEMFVENELDEGYEAFLDVPHMWDREIRHFMIDAGADLVICHHPHIIQGLEVYNGKLIAHSLGNFVFDLTYSETMPSMILHSEIDERGFYSYYITPIFIDHFIPRHAEGELGLHILNYLAQKSKEMNTYLDVNEEENRAYVIMDTLSMETQSQQFSSIFGLNSYEEEFISAPLRLQRWGNPTEILSLNNPSTWQYRMGTELIYYGNMEDEGSDMWNLNSSGEYYSEEIYFEGARSIEQTRISYHTDNVVTNFNQLHKLFPFDSYTLHGYIQTENGEEVTLEIRFYSSRNYNTLLDSEALSTSLSGDNGWNFLHSELTVPENAKFYDIRLVTNPPAEGTAYSRFDNVGLIGWSEWNNAESEPFISSPNNYSYIQMKSQQNSFFNDLIYTEIQYHYDPFVNQGEKIIPKVDARLEANFPNPFNARTTFQFSLEQSSDVELTIYNIKGQKVKKLVRSYQEPGNHYIDWDGKNSFQKPVTSGIYLYQLKANGKVIGTQKCLLLK